MFTQRISMDCTKEQYEKYLKDELLKMGYKEYVLVWKYDKNIIVNNWAGHMGNLASLNPTWKDDKDRLYLGSFNAELFLALAAMTDKAEGNYGEYVVGLNTGAFYKMKEEDRILSEYEAIRKATKEEIMAKFGEKKCNHNTLENKLDQLNEKGQIEINISFDATELNTEIDKVIELVKVTQENDAINLLKSKGYKILKPKTWEEI